MLRWHVAIAWPRLYNSETPDKESFSRIAKFYNIDGEILEAEQKMYASFCRVGGLGFTTVLEMLGGKCRRMIYSIYFQSFLGWCISLQ